MVLLVPGDCPALDPAQLTALLQSVEPAPSVVLVPDRHGTGTNGLMLHPPTAIEPSFGPGSRERHTALAEEAGASLRVEEMPSLVLDVDTPDDLAAMREVLERPAAARPTRVGCCGGSRATTRRSDHRRRAGGRARGRPG